MPIKSGVTVDGVLVPAANGAILTPGTGVTRAKVTAASFFCNTGATLQVYLIPSGGSASTTTQIIETVMVANTSYDALEIIGQSIESGGTLQANDGGTGTTINFIATITEYTGDD